MTFLSKEVRLMHSHESIKKKKSQTTLTRTQDIWMNPVASEYESRNSCRGKIIKCQTTNVETLFICFFHTFLWYLQVKQTALHFPPNFFQSWHHRNFSNICYKLLQLQFTWRYNKSRNWNGTCFQLKRNMDAWMTLVCFLNIFSLKPSICFLSLQFLLLIIKTGKKKYFKKPLHFFLFDLRWTPLCLSDFLFFFTLKMLPRRLEEMRTLRSPFRKKWRTNGWNSALSDTIGFFSFSPNILFIYLLGIQQFNQSNERSAQAKKQIIILKMRSFRGFSTVSQ